MAIEAPRKARKTAEERKAEKYLKQAVMVREGRLVRMIAGVKRASFVRNGEHLDVYASDTYNGYGYVVTWAAEGYVCTCDGYGFRHACVHSRNASARAIARYEDAQRQNELDEARVVAPMVLGQMAEDVQQHVADEFAPVSAEVYREMYPDDFYSAA
jgi:hypothetical protein